MRQFTLLIMMLFIFSCASTGMDQHGHDGFTQHYEESLFEVTKNGMFSVEMVLKGHELKTGSNSLDVIIHDKNDGDVTGAEITVIPWMPEMGSGVSEKPVVIEKGGGLYTVENIVLIMSGHWELRVSIKDGRTEDEAVFDFQDVKVDRGDEHKMIMAPASSDLDLSTGRFSDNRVFHVSYSSKLDPVPLNKIHTWILTVRTEDGMPVEGADISIEGDMPEHGHGLPTQPEVSAAQVSGTYLAEGLKFSMPGWWVMKFNIHAGDREDTVTFNLLLKE